MSKKEPETFYPKTSKEWREWLKINHELKQSIWVIFFKISTKKPSMSWGKAVDEALCFGWIDSTKKSIDNESYLQYYSKRKPSSTWSKINKDKIEVLIQNNCMTKAGFNSIEIAKQNGNWTLMDDVENLIVPEDLQIALSKNTSSLQFFKNHSNSIKKMMLYWVASAKRPETRQKRITDIVESAAKGVKPKHFG